MSTSMARRAIRAGAALAAALTLGFGAVACDDSAEPAGTKPTPSASAPATPAGTPEPEPTRSSPSPEPGSASPTPPAPAPTPKEEAPASAGGSTTTGGTTATGGSGSTGGSHSGASAVCNDGSTSYSAHRRGTCSHHGGVAQWLKDLPS